MSNQVQAPHRTPRLPVRPLCRFCLSAHHRARPLSPLASSCFKLWTFHLICLRSVRPRLRTLYSLSRRACSRLARLLAFMCSVQRRLCARVHSCRSTQAVAPVCAAQKWGWEELAVVRTSFMHLFRSAVVHEGDFNLPLVRAALRARPCLLRRE